MSQLIIHISGPSGAGKTTLGNKLIDKYGTKIIVKDIDDLRKEFINHHYTKTWNFKDFNADAYQTWIDLFVKKNKKPIVFVGLNNMPWWHKNLYYDMHSQHKFYIEIDNATILKQKCLRLFNAILNDDRVMNDLVNNNKKFIKFTTSSIEHECNDKKNIKMNKIWNKNYKEQGYIFMSRDDIYKKVCQILNKI